MNELHDYLKLFLLLLLIQFLRDMVLLPGKKKRKFHGNNMLKVKSIPRHISIYKIWSSFLCGKSEIRRSWLYRLLTSQVKRKKWLSLDDCLLWHSHYNFRLSSCDWHFRPLAWRRVIFYPTLEVKWAPWDPKSLTNPLLCHSEDLCLMRGLILQIAWGLEDSLANLNCSYFPTVFTELGFLSVKNGPDLGWLPWWLYQEPLGSLFSSEDSFVQWTPLGSKR